MDNSFITQKKLNNFYYQGRFMNVSIWQLMQYDTVGLSFVRNMVSQSRFFICLQLKGEVNRLMTKQFVTLGNEIFFFLRKSPNNQERHKVIKLLYTVSKAYSTEISVDCG